MHVSLTSADKHDVTTDRVYNLDDNVKVPDYYIGQTKPVCCYKFSLPRSMALSDIYTMNYLLYKIEEKITKAVRNIRCYYQDGCLQMNGIQEADNGKYMLLMKPVYLQEKYRLYISLSRLFQQVIR